MDNWIRFAIFLIYPNYALSQLSSVYDFIVVGSGPGGATVANRLTERQDWNVILFEVGKQETDWLQVPGLYEYAVNSEYDWAYKSEPEIGACLSKKDNRCTWRAGKSLGGSTSINGMAYARGHRADFNTWADYGNVGWGYEDLLPYFLKSEDVRIPKLMNTHHHMTSGYLSIEHVPYRTKLLDAFLEAGLEMGFPIVDINDGNLTRGFTPMEVTFQRGQRLSSSKAFLKPILYRNNLKVLTESRVTKILINPETKTAYGVEVLIGQDLYIFTARKEVILSAGPIASPQLLMLSGIGPKFHLNEMGIPVIQDLPVGQIMLNHVGFDKLSFNISQTGIGIDPSQIRTEKNFQLFWNEGKGPLTLPGFKEGLAFINTKLNRDVHKRPDIEIMFLSTTSNTGVGFSQYANRNGRESWSVRIILLDVKSRGQVRLKSRNPLDDPNVRANFFQVETDLYQIVEGIKFIVDMSKTKAFQQYGSQIVKYPIPGCDHIPFATDSYWECAVRHEVFILEHYTATCKMGPAQDPTAVVSPELKVHGIKNLRVVDSSVFPTGVTGHNVAAAYVVGEKGSDLIKSSWYYVN